MKITLELSPDVETRLRESATRYDADTMRRLLVERFVSPFQVKLLVAGKVEAHRAAVQMVWDAG